MCSGKISGVGVTTTVLISQATGFDFISSSEPLNRLMYRRRILSHFSYCLYAKQPAEKLACVWSFTAVFAATTHFVHSFFQHLCFRFFSFELCSILLKNAWNEWMVISTICVSTCILLPFSLCRWIICTIVPLLWFNSSKLHVCGSLVFHEFSFL